MATLLAGTGVGLTALVLSKVDVEEITNVETIVFEYENNADQEIDEEHEE